MKNQISIRCAGPVYDHQTKAEHKVLRLSCSRAMGEGFISQVLHLDHAPLGAGVTKVLFLLFLQGFFSHH
jgi:hypothetical protein